MKGLSGLAKKSGGAFEGPDGREVFGAELQRPVTGRAMCGSIVLQRSTSISHIKQSNLKKIQHQNRMKEDTEAQFITLLLCCVTS